MPVLRHWLIAPESAPTPPRRWLLLLHGIYGSGANWRGFGRRLVAALPAELGLGAVLVDLRMHGESQGFAPPHTLQAAAADLRALAAHLPGEVVAVLGHSFGGKVALCYARQVAGAGQGDPAPAPGYVRASDLRSVFVVDSTPGARPTARGSQGVLRVLNALRSLPAVHDSRESFVAQLMALGSAREAVSDREARSAAVIAREAQGAAVIDRPLAQWLAMNLRGGAGAFRFTLDLDAMAALLADYFVADLWDVVEHPPGRLRVHLVIGDRSDVFDAADRARAARSAAQAAPDVATGTRVTLDVLPAGHFVHVDDPAGLLRVVVAGLTADIA